jgi:hypothetical protein
MPVAAGVTGRVGLALGLRFLATLPWWPSGRGRADVQAGMIPYWLSTRGVTRARVRKGQEC